MSTEKDTNEDNYHAKFSLHGVSCAACTSTIENLLTNTTGITSVNVSLLPFPTAELDYNNLIVQPPAIIESIEEIGFDAELIDSIQKCDDGIRMRTVRIEVEYNVMKVMEYLNSHEAVDLVEDISKKSKSGVLSVRYRNDICGIRDIVEGISSNNMEEEKKEEEVPFGYIRVTTSTNYQTELEYAEVQRQAEIKEWRNGFIFSAIFAIPIFIIAMIFMKIPGPIKDFLHSIAIANINWEELLSWIMATPVQFISGYRFYYDSYYQLKTLHLGMSFLIALGTSAAYFYSVFVVIYNAKTDIHPRLMVAFETSALLICFVLLGKYLLAKAKARTSKALSKLCSLTPEEATLVGTADQGLSIHDCIERKIPSSLIQNNDVLFVRPG